MAQHETRFPHEAGVVHGTLKHLTEENKTHLTIDLISNEAVTTSEIEGAILNHNSVQSSLRRNFWLETDNRKIPAAEQGIAAMMTDLYRHYDSPLSEQQLFAWHTMLAQGRKDLKRIGAYRAGTDPMQVVSGPIGKPRVHFEAPPSKALEAERNRFFTRFNQTSPNGPQPLPTSHRHQSFAGPGGEGRLPQDRRAQAHPILAEYSQKTWRSLMGQRMVRGHAKDLVLPPADSDEFIFLVRRVGYTTDDWQAGARHLQTDIRHHMGLTKQFFERMFESL